MYTVPSGEMDFIRECGKMDFLFKKGQHLAVEKLSREHSRDSFLPYYIGCRVVYTYTDEGIENSQIIGTGKLSKTHDMIVPNDPSWTLTHIEIEDFLFAKDYKSDQKYLFFDMIVKRLVEIAKEELDADMVSIDSRETILMDVGIDNHMSIGKVASAVAGQTRMKVKWIRNAEKVEACSRVIPSSAICALAKRFNTIH